MLITNIIDEDHVSYMRWSMVVGFPYCTFKCGKDLCQNVALADGPLIEINPKDIALRYYRNPLTSALVCAGLEPFDSPNHLLCLLFEFRMKTHDPFIIYTGYEEDEIAHEVEKLTALAPLIVKYGRYDPTFKSRYDPVLGIYLSTGNQYAKKYD